MKTRQTIKSRPDVQALEPPKKPALPELAVFILFAFMITLFGLIMLYSTSFVTQGSSYFKKQLMWMIIGSFAGVGTVRRQHAPRPCVHRERPDIGRSAVRVDVGGADRPAHLRTRRGRRRGKRRRQRE